MKQLKIRRLCNCNLESPVYEYGLKELWKLCGFYGTKKNLKHEYFGPITNSSAVRDDWSYLKLMILHNFDSN